MNTPQLTPTIKQAIFEQARSLMREWYGESLAEQGACLYCRYNKAATEYVWKFILRKFNPQHPEPKDNVLA